MAPQNPKNKLAATNYSENSKKLSARISKKQYNLELDAAMKRMDSGKYMTQLEVEKKFSNEK